MTRSLAPSPVPSTAFSDLHISSTSSTARSTPMLPSEDSESNSDEEDERFVFKPHTVGSLIDAPKPKHGIHSDEQPMMECIAHLLSRHDIVPPTAILTVKFDSPKAASFQEPIELKSSEEEDDEEELEIGVDIDVDDEANIEIDIDVRQIFKSNLDDYEDTHSSPSTKLKTGSAQRYVPGTTTLKELDDQEWAERIEKISLEQVQDLAVLDIRTYNTDRHLGNILINKENQIFAIDHGCIATRAFKDPALFSWLTWPKAHIPFSEEQKAYIASLKWEDTETAILKDFKEFPKESLETLKYSHFLLQEGAHAGLTPFQIGCFMVGCKIMNNATLPSPLQLLYEKHKEKPEQLQSNIRSLMSLLLRNMESLKSRSATENKPLENVVRTFLLDRL